MARRNDDILDRLLEGFSLRGIVLHPATLFVIATMIMIGAAIFLWERHQAKIVNLEEFRLTEDKIQLTTPPIWSTDNLKQMVINGNSKPASNNDDKAASILDTQLVDRTARVMKQVGYVERVKSVHKSCLLYTSPSPRDATLSRMPSSA